MCLAVYLAAARPLPLVAWNQQRPAFHITEIAPEHEIAVRAHFTLPYVYYVGSHTYCGCGFNSDAGTGREEAQAAAGLLAEYLTQHIKRGRCELYSVWESDQHLPPRTRRNVTPRYFAAGLAEFRERELSLVKIGAKES